MTTGSVWSGICGTVKVSKLNVAVRCNYTTPTAMQHAAVNGSLTYMTTDSPALMLCWETRN